MGQGEKVWPLLALRPDPTLRNFLVQSMADSGVDHKALFTRLDEEKEVSVRRAILLALGRYGLDRLPEAERSNYMPRLLDLYRDDPDPGVHSATEWLLWRWGGWLDQRALDAKLPTGKPAGNQRWYHTGRGQTMVIIETPGEFRMGEGDERHRRRIDRPFAIASEEVTTDQFLHFRPRHDFNKWYAPDSECPALFVRWYDAAAYCNWLSGQEGIPEDQWCYLPNKDGKYADGMSIVPDYLKRTGYRLPTEAEWEFCCRAGAETEYSFGAAVELLDRYGWYDGNSHGVSASVSSLRPNDFGLFDMHGNAWEWCQDAFQPNPKTADDKLVPDPEGGVVDDKAGRVLRGGSFNNPPTSLRSHVRNEWLPAKVDNAVGFRVARTLPR